MVRVRHAPPSPPPPSHASQDGPAMQLAVQVVDSLSTTTAAPRPGLFSSPGMFTVISTQSPGARLVLSHLATALLAPVTHVVPSGFPVQSLLLLHDCPPWTPPQVLSKQDESPRTKEPTLLPPVGELSTSVQLPVTRVVDARHEPTPPSAGNV